MHSSPLSQLWRRVALPEKGALRCSVLRRELSYPQHGVNVLARIEGKCATAATAAVQLSFEEAVTLPCAGVTALSALFERHPVQPGETVLLLGTGGVSILGLQLAKAAGSRVIITSSSDGKLGRSRALGADHLINYRDTPDWVKEVLRLTGGIAPIWPTPPVPHLKWTGSFRSTFMRRCNRDRPSVGHRVASVHDEIEECQLSERAVLSQRNSSASGSLYLWTKGLANSPRTPFS
jgi:Zn-dependent alcohol dehydrogenase